MILWVKDTELVIIGKEGGHTAPVHFTELDELRKRVLKDARRLSRLSRIPVQKIIDHHCEPAQLANTIAACRYNKSKEFRK